MSTKKETIVTKTDNNDTGLFGNENYMWMLAGLAVILIGFLLMSGGKSSDPKFLIRKKFTALHVSRLRRC